MRNLRRLCPVLLVLVAACGGGGVGQPADRDGPHRVLIIHKGTDASGLASVVSQLQGAGFFTVQTFDAGASPSPGPAVLSAYHAVLVWGDGQFSDAVTLGSDLAQFADAGGGVVLAMFLFRGGALPVPNFNEGLGGAWDGFNFFAIPEEFPPTDSPIGCGALPVVPDLSMHPILTGGVLASGLGVAPPCVLPTAPPVCTHQHGTTIVVGATLLAHWSDSVPFLAERPIGLAHVRTVNVGATPPELASSPGAFRVLVNSLLYVVNDL